MAPSERLRPPSARLPAGRKRHGTPIRALVTIGPRLGLMIARVGNGREERVVRNVSSDLDIRSLGRQIHAHGNDARNLTEGPLDPSDARRTRSATDLQGSVRCDGFVAGFIDDLRQSLGGSAGEIGDDRGRFVREVHVSRISPRLHAQEPVDPTCARCTGHPRNGEVDGDRCFSLSGRLHLVHGR